MIHDKDDSAASDDVGDECGGGLGQGEDPVHHGGSQHHPGDALLSESGSQWETLSEQSDLHHQGSGWYSGIQQVLQGTIFTNWIINDFKLF